MISRRTLFQAAIASLLPMQTAAAGRKPPAVSADAYEVILPRFMDAIISERDINYLNEIIPTLFETYRNWLPALDAPPLYIVVNTMTEALVNYGGTHIAEDLLTDEALTLFDVQFLLVTTRFGSVATPHRGENMDIHGKYVYLKQHPQAGYNTPPHLLLEEMLHAQQDITIMRNIIEREQLDPTTCLHGQLKGISELGAHYYTDALANDVDYVFVLDDGTHCDSAEHGVRQLAKRLDTEEMTFLRAITYDLSLYNQLDKVAVSQHGKHIWEMVTTWRHARDAEGNAVDIAPAFQPF